MNLQLYSLLYFVVAGQLLTEAFSVSGKRTAAAQPVNTTAKGFAGLSPGAPMFTCDVSNAIPAAGFEVDMGTIIAQLQVVESGVLGPGGKNLIVKGFVPEDSFKHSVGSAGQYDFTFMAPLGQFT